MTEPSTNIQNLAAQALTGLVKQIKAIRYYPPQHPALKATAEESLKGFIPLFAERGHFAWTVRKEVFLVDDEPIAKGNQALSKLATFLFARRIQYLTIFADLTSRDLSTFIRYLILDPQELLKMGGVQTVFEKAGISTIWVNEKDLDDILAKKEIIEAQEEEPLLPPAGESEGQRAIPGLSGKHPETHDLEKLLKAMFHEKSDQRFRSMLQQLIPLVRLNLNETGRKVILQAFVLLCKTASEKRFSETRHEYSQHALGQLSSNDILDHLIAHLCGKDLSDKERQTLLRILTFLDSKVIRQIVDFLARETSPLQRKHLAEALVLQGNRAVPILQESLFDERWYVVRNAIVILGEIRNEDSLVHLTPLLHHNDIRVRRETMRTLTKIGGQRAVGILLQAAEEGDQELRRQALISLGAIKNSTAVPTLLKLANRGSLTQKAFELRKDAIKSLGEIGSSDAVPSLIRILKKHSLWRRARNQELQLLAATALGEIGDSAARPALESATNERNAATARAAAQALKNLKG